MTESGAFYQTKLILRTSQSCNKKLSTPNNELYEYIRK